MYYVYGQTTGDAQKHLLPRYDPNSTNPYSNFEDMLAYLASIYADAYKKANASGLIET